MKTRSQTHEIELQVPPERVFDVLITPSAIRDWWGAHRAAVMPEQGGWWVAAWGEREDDPDYVTGAIIRVFDRPHRLVLAYENYYAKAGRLPFDANMSVEFLIERHQSGTRLRLTQDGFPAEPVADAYYEGCRQGWQATLSGIKRLITA